MTIKLTESEIDEQFQKADEKELQFDPSDDQDITFKFDTQIAQGWLRAIWLREGILLRIEQCQHTDYLTISRPPIGHCYITCRFLLSGNTRVRTARALGESSLTHAVGQYHLIGTGSRGQRLDDFDIDCFLIHLEIPQSVFRSFAASLQKELPKQLQRLVRPLNQEIFQQSRCIQPEMNTVLQQILHCPYEGMVKRAYLESKVIELMALVLAREVVIREGEVKPGALKPEQLEQIHYAKEILLRDMGNPPSLAELAQQAGLNDFMLRQGFRQAFGTTVFGQLQTYRLNIAKQLLSEQDMSVSEITRKVGYTSVSYFSRAFKKKFGIGPKAYQKTCR